MKTVDLEAALDSAIDHIDDHAEAARPSRTRPALYVAALRAAVLFADSSYQRVLDDLRVQRMVDDFDPTLLGVLEVSDRENGTFAILDGQHRWAVVQDAHPDHAEAHLVCQVHRGLTVEDEARVFYEIDVRRKTLSGWDRWKARRGAGDPTVLSIERVVRDADLSVEPSSRDGNVAATVALEKVWRIGGDALLSSTLTVLRFGFGAVRDAFDGQLIQAAAIVLTTYDADELDVQRLIEQLQTIPPRMVKARAQALKEAHRAELARLCAAVMIERYNAGPGRKVEELLSRTPAQSRSLSKAGHRSRQLSAIRRWAERNGRPCPTARVPREVLEAYTVAHPGFELASS
jgi:hypothetical protein